LASLSDLWRRAINGFSKESIEAFQKALNFGAMNPSFVPNWEKMEAQIASELGRVQKQKEEEQNRSQEDPVEGKFQPLMHPGLHIQPQGGLLLLNFRFLLLFNSVPKKKKKKKKKKKIEKGRSFVASKAIPEGTDLLREQAYTSILFRQHMEQYCSYCLQKTFSLLP